ncbi:LLM class flavin-dependent oxidoreductase [Chelatococcus sambhunathii]|uniref:LLM class flavin-dependent oxidoreductase n=1 Tax=Chelatococcus sambhunathii TaxID=363953 RepID=A0ABU1DAE2_9HYPH|nr:LLM class flavin-dependent oxidoreductase [Chelatococcus sambhunathii]MDR4305020.1 LLM class flavin-dependent oxidoreductase [Chelatococcus sambhunathii]
MLAETPAVRFGIWALVHGSRAALNDPREPYDASWERNASLVAKAESLGYDSVLVAQHTVNPHDPDRDELEAWTASAALAAITRKIEIITAVKPLSFHPVVLAKMALQIEAISRGRFAINVVNAWNLAEFEKAGVPFPEHDARYAYGTEWLEVVSRLMTGETVNHDGDQFHVRDYKLRPASPYRERPAIYVGGESEPARKLVNRLGDTWFLNGQSLESVRALIADARSRQRSGAPLAFGLSAFVIARESRAEAEDEHAHLAELAAKDAAVKAQQKANTDPDSTMWNRMARVASVGTNGGTAAGLVGSYDDVAERVAAFRDAGIGLFMLQFQPFEAEMKRFAQEILPRFGVGSRRRVKAAAALAR